MGKLVVGQSREGIATAAVQMKAMLAGQGDGPTGQFEEFQILKSAQQFENRHRSILLPFAALEKAFDQGGTD